MADNTFIGTIGAGVQNSSSGNAGQMVPPVMGPQQDQLVSQLHGEYFEQARRANQFFAGIVGQVTTVGLATTYTGLVLSNPPGSGKLVIVDELNYAFLVAFAAAAAVGIMVGYSTTEVTHTTPVTVRQNRIGASMGAPSAVGKVDSAATLPVAPVVHSLFDAGLTGPNVYQAKGGIILEPGGFAAVYTSTASGAASMAASWKWHEITQ